MMDNSLKEYYVNLQKQYNKAVSILTAINQSFSTSSSEISINMADTDDGKVTTLRIPSFLYLESKIEQLESNFNELFKMPYSGEAWFQKVSNMYKLKLVKANQTPSTPLLDDTENNIFVQTKDNNILRDLVSPKTYFKMNISNLTDNIEKMFMKKIIIYDGEVYDQLYRKDLHTYQEYKAALFNLRLGIDYDEYDTEIDLPIKYEEYVSEFKIMDIPKIDGENPWYDINYSDDGRQHLLYKVRLDTIKYANFEDNSIEFNLKVGDYVCLDNEMVIYKINAISNFSNPELEEDSYVILEEITGHIALQTYEDNSAMVLKLYNQNYDKYHYVEVPLEENQYICVFLGTIYNNVRSSLSEGVLLNLDTIYMKDAYGNYVVDSSGNRITYMTYYNEYCKNIGDIILGLTSTAYPQLTNYTSEQLYILQESDSIKQLVTDSIAQDDNLVVMKINDHLVDTEATKNISSLHESKNNLNSLLSNLQANIDQVNNQLATTDFSQEITVSQASLKSQLDDYYTQKLSIQKQLIAVVENINILKSEAKGVASAKYRIRGVADETTLESFLSDYNKCEVIGIEVEYKYKTTSGNTTSLTDINSNIFSNWNRLETIDRQRKLVFSADTKTYSIDFDNYDKTTNIIKWNQIDIPITQGEDVIIRIRFKYNIGQPFINLYTPWSSEQTIVFPSEYVETNDLMTILESNDEDVVSSKFQKTLINDGYQEHVNNKIIDNSQIFYHMPENIYSGFNTAENKLISLKDKLNDIVNDLIEYKTMINATNNQKYKIVLEWENNAIEINPNVDNNIYINESNYIAINSFTKKKMNLTIKNVGDENINLYSIFPGNTDIPLICWNRNDYSFDKYIQNYERVPILIGDSTDALEQTCLQTLGQWIYFRQNNPYTGMSLYYDSDNQRTKDWNSAKNIYNKVISSNTTPTLNATDEAFEYVSNQYARLSSNYEQPLLGYKKHTMDDFTTNLLESIESNNGLDQSSNINWQQLKNILTELNTSVDYTLPVFNEVHTVKDGTSSEEVKKGYCYYYPIALKNSNNANTLVFKYEHIKNISGSYLEEGVSIKSFLGKNTISSGNYSSEEKFTGAFFIPELSSKSQIICNNTVKNQSYSINPGTSTTIPLIFEYYIPTSFTNEVNTKITKGLCFDIKPSLFEEPVHYIINITASYNYNTELNENLNVNTGVTGDEI